MKIFVMVDMEGISGICRASQVLPTGPHYNEGRLFLTQDVNACVDGCFLGGAKTVVVRDAHTTGFNLLWERLDPRAEYIQGDSVAERMPGIRDFDGLILLGYHAMAGTKAGVLEHTMSSAQWQNFWINRRKAGEIALDAAIAGENGVPTLMVSGDDKTCREARAFLPGVVTAQVKVGLAVEGAQLLSAPAAHALLRERAAEAVKRCRKIKPFRVKKPVTCRLELVSRGRVPAPHSRPGLKLIDARTYEVTADTVEACLFRL